MNTVTDIESLAFVEAEKTTESLNGRWFSGRMIKAEMYDQATYEAEDFSG